MRELNHGQVIPLAEALDRRSFCRTLGAGAALVVLPACSSATGHGGFEPDDGASPDDMARAPGDGADLMHAAGNCPAGITDSGRAPSAFAVNTATFFRDDALFVCRDAKGLFCLSSRCTHANCDVDFVSAARGFS